MLVNIIYNLFIAITLHKNDDSAQSTVVSYSEDSVETEIDFTRKCKLITPVTTTMQHK